MPLITIKSASKITLSVEATGFQAIGIGPFNATIELNQIGLTSIVANETLFIFKMLSDLLVVEVDT